MLGNACPHCKFSHQLSFTPILLVFVKNNNVKTVNNNFSILWQPLSLQIIKILTELLIRFYEIYKNGCVNNEENIALKLYTTSQKKYETLIRRLIVITRVDSECRVSAWFTT